MSANIKQLKAQAFRLAGVNTTKALKKIHAGIAGLDMRLKISWIRAIEILENLSKGIPTWDGDQDTLDSTITKLFDFQEKLVSEISEIALDQISVNQEFIL